MNIFKKLTYRGWKIRGKSQTKIFKNETHFTIIYVN